jgi:ElaB/YqjD/DUF883 family membrane-anchored ribosome-binding protein
MAYRAEDEDRRMDDDTTPDTAGGTTDDPEALRAEIDQTRARMSETLDELGERLNPQNIKEQVKDQLRDATIGTVADVARSATERVRDSGGTIMSVIRDNPIPAAMVAVGLGWMLVNSRRENGRGYERGDYELSERPWREEGMGYSGSGYTGGSGSAYVGGMYREGTIAGGYESSGRYGDEDQGVADRVREKAGELKHRAGELGHKAQDAASRVGERARGVAHTTAERARELGHSVSETTRRQATRVEHGYEENPLIFGALAIALGVGAGLAMPATRREQEWMGDARDRVVDRVKEVASEKGERAKHVAERVYDTAKETARQAARDEGLTRKT